MEKDQYILLVYKRLKGIISPQEENSLRNWEDQKEEHRQLTESVEQAWEESHTYELPFALDEDADFAKVQARIKGQAASAKTVTMSPRKRSWWPVAAAIALVLGMTFVISNMLQADRADWVVVAADKGIKQIVLSDGSEVWLNTGSQLSYPEQFTEDARPLKLEGEAYFKVSKDPARPFSVETARTITTVLGTAFNLRAVTEESTTEVSVQEGSVQLMAKATEEKVILGEQERGIYQHQPTLLRKLADENLNALAWQRQSIQFNGDELAEVMALIATQYQVKINLEKESMSVCPVSGRYSTKTSLTALLQDITAVYEMQIEQPTANEYVLKGGVCH